jgi:hypothetical protein
LYFCFRFFSYLRRELVEDVEITLALLLPHHTRLFQKIRVNLGASQRKPLVEVNVDVLAWCRVYGLGVTGFQGLGFRRRQSAQTAGQSECRCACLV